MLRHRRDSGADMLLVCVPTVALSTQWLVVGTSIAT